jgi:zinc protease
LFVYGLAPDYYDRLARELAQVGVEDVQRVARAYLDPDRMVVVSVGERRKILPQLQKLGLGQPEIRDDDGQVMDKKQH